MEPGNSAGPIVEQFQEAWREADGEHSSRLAEQQVAADSSLSGRWSLSAVPRGAPSGEVMDPLMRALPPMGNVVPLLARISLPGQWDTEHTPLASPPSVGLPTTRPDWYDRCTCVRIHAVTPTSLITS